VTKLVAGEKGTAGFALIVVLWFLVLISAIGIYLMIGARSETAVARNVRAAANAEALADAGVAEAIFNRSEPAAANRWPLDGSAHLLTLPAGRLSLRLYDERQKINPNHASDALLAGLFEAAGVDRGLAQRLGASVADWVSPSQNPRPLGAKQEQYAAAGRSYGPPGAPLESLDELQLVLGLTPEILARVRPYLTIYTDGGELPDLKTASPIVRRAIELAGRRAAIVEGVQSRDNESQPQEADAGAVDAPGEADSSDAASDSSADASAAEILEIDVLAEPTSGGVFARRAVVRLDPGKPKGYVVLDWRRSELATEQQSPSP
jgi:general secretion pathway protein K